RPQSRRRNTDPRQYPGRSSAADERDALDRIKLLRSLGPRRHQPYDVVTVKVLTQGKHLAVPHLDRPGIQVVVWTSVGQIAPAVRLNHPERSLRGDRVHKYFGIAGAKQASDRLEEFVDDSFAATVHPSAGYVAHLGCPGCVLVQHLAYALQ